MPTAIFYVDGQWSFENPKLTGPADHSFWMASMVFDGARAFSGLTPDLDLHCQRVVRSARTMMLNPRIDAATIEALCREGVERLGRDRELYIKPMFYCTGGFVTPDPEQTQFVLHIFDAPMPADSGFSVTVSPFRRADPEMAPTDAKASCLYPNGQRAIAEAANRGFTNALMLDSRGNVAELATANIFMVKQGKAYTPLPNGTFLNGITKARVSKLLSGNGVEVIEKALTPADFSAADEVFSVGNFGKVLHASQFEQRKLDQGKVSRLARQLYFDWAATQKLR